MSNAKGKISSSVDFEFDEKTKELILKVRLTKKGMSKSGQNMSFGTTNGNQPININGKVIKVGLNIFGNEEI